MSIFAFKPFTDAFWAAAAGGATAPHPAEEPAPDPFHIAALMHDVEAAKASQPEIKALDADHFGTPGTAKDGRHVGREGSSLGATWTDKAADGSITQTGANVSADGLQGGRRVTTKTDADGKAVDSAVIGGGVSQDGFNAGASSTTGGTTAAINAKVGFDGSVGGGASYGNDKNKVGFNFETKANETTIGGSFKRGDVGGSAAVTEYSGTKSGKIGEDGNDAAIHDILGGDGKFVERDSGHAGKLGLSISNGMFGAGAEGHLEHKDVVRYFHAGNDAIAQPGAIPGIGPANKLDGHAAFTDVDVGQLAAGEGYSFETQKGNGEKGSLTAGITVSLGREHAEASQTVLARDAKGDLRVTVAEGAQTALTGGISAKDIVGASATNTDADLAKVSFTAHGKEGEAAVRQFQQTGALPGAEQVAWKVNPVAAAELEVARSAWLAEQAKANEPGAAERIEAARAKLVAAAGPVNAAFQNARGDTLETAKVPGVTYDEHTTTHQHAEDDKLSLFGLDLLKRGFTESETESEYRADGKAHTERDYHRQDRYWFAANEDSHIAMDPKGYGKQGDAAVGMVMASQQETTDHERDVLAKLGPAAFGMPQESVEAWRKGDMHTGVLQQVSLTMTEGQLATLRDKVAPADAAHVERSLHGVGALYEDQKRFADPMARFGAMGPMASEDTREKAKLAEQLDPMYQAALASHMTALAAKGDVAGVAKLAVAQMTGHAMDEEVAHLGGVKSKADFLALTPDEQKLVITTGAIENAREGRSAFDEVGLVLSVSDKKQRDELMREMYETEERRKKGADATVSFIDFVNTEGTKTIGAADTSKLLSGAAVRGKDDQREALEASRDKAEKDKPGSGNAKLGKGLAEALSDDPAHRMMRAYALSADTLQQSEGERAAAPVTRFLEAAHGSKNIEAMLDAGVAEDPHLISKIMDHLADDPARRAEVDAMLRGTRYDIAATRERALKMFGIEPAASAAPANPFAHFGD